jgi:hypothetical protein
MRGQKSTEFRDIQIVESFGKIDAVNPRIDFFAPGRKIHHSGRIFAAILRDRVSGRTATAAKGEAAVAGLQIGYFGASCDSEQKSRQTEMIRSRFQLEDHAAA